MRRFDHFFKGVLCALLLFTSSLFAEKATAQNIDSKGTEFWLMFNANFDLDLNIELFITSDVNTSGTVEIPGLSFSEDFTVTANEITTITLPVDVVVLGANEIANKGIHVVSDDEVTVYGLNQREFSTDAYLGLPVDALGTEYLILTFPNGNFANLSRTQFGMVATEDNTTVTIVPTAAIGGNPAGVPYQIVLNAGEVYQGRPVGALLDVSGTSVVADKPIGVFGSHICGNVPTNVNFCDHLVEMLPATDTWGQNFVTMPFANRIGGDIFRIMAAEDATQITINGVVQGTINEGDVFEINLIDPSQISTSKPALVAQFMKGNEADGPELPGDPSMMIVAPFEQFLANYTVSTPAVGFVDNYINVVVANAGVGTIILDGVAIPASDFQAIGSSGFSGAQVEIDLGSHNLNSATPFGVFVYGVNADDSYGYPGGQLFSLVATVNELVLEPEATSAQAFTEVCLEALLTDAAGAPVTGVRIDFEVSGANDLSGFAFTNSSGVATFCYTSEVEGLDEVTALQGELTDVSSVEWTAPDLDCNGTPFGEAFIDLCGQCVGGTTGLIECEVDCAGQPGGSSLEDACGVCRTPDDPDFNSTCIDCNGELTGTAFIDECGQCVGGSTGIEPCVPSVDCAGILNGPNVLDECGVCRLTSDPLFNSTCTDCNGEVNGNATPGTPCETSSGQSGTLTADCECEPSEPGECVAFRYFLSNHNEGAGTSTIYEVELDDVNGEANLTELLTLPYATHLAYDGNQQLLYIIRGNGGSFRALDVSIVGGALSAEIAPSVPLGNTPAAAFNSAGQLYIGSVTNQAIYHVNKTTGVATFYADAPVAGGDITFTQSGDLLLATRANNGTLQIIAPGNNQTLGNIPKLVTGLAIMENGMGLISFRNTAKLFYGSANTATASGNYDLLLNGNLFTKGNGDLASGCTNFDVVIGECYASQMLVYTQGTGNIPSDRLDPFKALGEPERDNTVNFVSLGFGGTLILGLGGSAPALPGVDDLEVVETTFNNQTCTSFEERANVYVSQQVVNDPSEIDHTLFAYVGQSCTNGAFFDVHEATGFDYFTLVKIVDASPVFSNRDGYDVDGIVALHNCTPETVALAPESGDVNAEESLGLGMLTSHPNPTQGASFVEFTLPATQRATLEVYDLSGRLVATLFGATAEAGLTYRTQFDAAGLPNGIYVYRLTGENEVKIEKFIVAH